MVRINKLSEKQKDIIRRPFNYELEVNEGTPRSGKTTAGHFRYARYLIQSEDENHLIAAYNQEQAYRLFIDGDGTGLMHIFNGNCWIKHDDRGDHLLIDTPKGQKRVYYKGGGKVNSVGAITGMSLGSVVFCEINLLHMDFIQECFRRTWAAKLRYHLADLNPPAPQHPVIKDVFDVQNTRWTHWTMDDNPILSEERKQSIINNLRKNPYLYKRDVLGQRVMPQGVIYGLFDMDKNIKDTLIGEPVEMYFCGDGGQSDATSMSCNIVTRIRKSMKTATEIVSENSDTYQLRNSIVALVEQSIKELVVSICELAKGAELYDGDIPELKDIEVNLDDGIFTDRNAELDYWTKALASGIVSKEYAMKKVLGLADNELKEIIRQINQEKPSSSEVDEELYDE